MKDTRGPCGLLWHARVGGWDSEVEYAVRPSRLPIACTQATHGGTKRNEHKGKTLTERTCRYMGGSELNWVFFPESMFCRTGTGAGDLGIARRELQHTVGGRQPVVHDGAHALDETKGASGLRQHLHVDQLVRCAIERSRGDVQNRDACNRGGHDKNEKRA